MLSTHRNEALVSSRSVASAGGKYEIAVHDAPFEALPFVKLRLRAFEEPFLRYCDALVAHLKSPNRYALPLRSPSSISAIRRFPTERQKRCVRCS